VGEARREIKEKIKGGRRRELGLKIEDWTVA